MTPHAHHCSGHAHVHGHAAGINDTNRLTIALFIILGFAVVEVIGAAISGSLALLADAGHMITDGVAIALALVARRLAEREPTKNFPFGQHRAQVLAAFVNGLALFVLIAFLLSESFHRFANPDQFSVDAAVMMWVAILGLLANIAAFAVLHKGNMRDVNMRGAILHVIGDILGSVAAITSALIIAGTGWMLADPLVTVIVCALIARSAWGLVYETGRVLLQGAPQNIDGEELSRELGKVAHVTSIEEVKVWMLTPEKVQINLRAKIDHLQHCDEVLKNLQLLLAERFSIDDSTIQLESSVKGSDLINSKNEPALPVEQADQSDAPSPLAGSTVHPVISTVH